MGKGKADVLAVCLEGIRAGRFTMDECLSAHPGQAEALRPLIQRALNIVPPAPAAVDPGFRLRARSALMQAISGEQEAAPASPLHSFWKSISGGRKLPARPAGAALRLAAMAVSILLVLTAALGGGATYASQKALPGDPLYRVKLTVETVQMSLATDDLARARAYAACAETRVEEAQGAVGMERPESAGWAAERYSACVAKAEWYLEVAATSGRDVSELASRFSEDFRRQWATLEDAAGHTKGETWKALDRAAKDAGKARQAADSLRKGGGPGSGRQEMTPSPEATEAVPAGDPGRDGGSGKSAPEVTVVIPAELASALRQILSDVQGLATDPRTAGQSFKGLVAKLEAAQESMERERPNAAINELDGFLNELNGMLRSGHVTAQNYEKLYSEYSDLIAKLGGTPRARLVPAQPEATPRPAPPSDGQGRGGRGPEDLRPEGDRDNSGPGGGRGEDGPNSGPRGDGRDDEPEDTFVPAPAEEPDRSGPGSGGELEANSPNSGPGSGGGELQADSPNSGPGSGGGELQADSPNSGPGSGGGELEADSPNSGPGSGASELEAASPNSGPGSDSAKSEDDPDDTEVETSPDSRELDEESRELDEGSDTETDSERDRGSDSDQE